MSKKMIVVLSMAEHDKLERVLHHYKGLKTPVFKKIAKSVENAQQVDPDAGPVILNLSDHEQTVYVSYRDDNSITIGPGQYRAAEKEQAESRCHRAGSEPDEDMRKTIAAAHHRESRFFNQALEAEAKKISSRARELVSGDYKATEERALAHMIDVNVTYVKVKGTDTSRVFQIEGPSLNDLPMKYRNGEHVYVAGNTLFHGRPRGGSIVALCSVGPAYHTQQLKDIQDTIKRCTGRLKCILNRKGTGVVIKTEECLPGDQYFVKKLVALRWEELPREYTNGECVYLGNDGGLYYRPAAGDHETLLKVDDIVSGDRLGDVKRICEKCGNRLHKINKDHALGSIYGIGAVANVPKTVEKIRTWRYNDVVLKIKTLGVDKYTVIEANTPSGGLFTIERAGNHVWLEGRISDRHIVTLNTVLSDKKLRDIKKCIRQEYFKADAKQTWRT